MARWIWPSASLPQSVVVSGREAFDEPVSPYPASCLPGCLGQDRSIESQVVLNVPGEQKEVLLHEPDQRPEIGSGELSDVQTIDQDPAPVRVVEAQQEIDDGRLTGSSAADQSDRLAG